MRILNLVLKVLVKQLYSLLVVGLLPACSASAVDDWPAFPVDWAVDGASPADLSFLLKPANEFIRVKDGHLVRGEEGARFRIWGINATGDAALPSTNSAPVVAAALARRGINCVRFHFLDKVGALIPGAGDNTRSLDPVALGKLDRFVFELKRRGIYTDLNLNVYRKYKAGDGVRDCDLLGIGKGVTYFDERLIELQREYARQLLTHVNPFTGRAYCEEPAVAIVEFVNENSLVEAWVNNRLTGSQTNKPSGTWHDIPPSYAAALTEKYHAWLKKRGRDAVPRLSKEGFGKADKERFQAEASFYMEIENNYFRDMAKFLRDDVGVKALLIGNSDHGHGRSCYPLVASLAQLDVVDSHVYWQHPNYISDPKSGKRTGFRITNTPMVDDPLHSSVVQLSRTAVAGKPFTVSEVNHPFPNEYACEGVPILAAYAALQDWDGIFWYTLGHKDVAGWTNAVPGHFDFAPDPVKMSQIAAGALVFLRGDVKVARKTVYRSYSREQVIESLRLSGKDQPYFTPCFPLALPLTHAVRVSSFDGPPTGLFEAVPVDNIVTDTGELKWHKGFVSVDTSHSQALVGRIGGHTRNLRAEIQTPFCALTLGSLDGNPVSTAGRLLLTAGGRVSTTGMVWDEKRKTLEKWGVAPVCVEPVVGKVLFVGLENVRAASAQPLDGAGRPMGQPVPLSRVADGWSMSLGQPATTWYVITIMR
ncbi:MAG: hypothetical protein A2283_18440 [Lentisphaerae bacterium RIFOXYA12_FULL_48_11]|nr:MAG: hypothetical protein A2283_18440 [Lentisphaerae bacterium RIFOXYA12_FULL_48_11]